MTISTQGANPMNDSTRSLETAGPERRMPAATEPSRTETEMTDLLPGLKAAREIANARYLSELLMRDNWRREPGRDRVLSDAHGDRAQALKEYIAALDSTIDAHITPSPLYPDNEQPEPCTHRARELGWTCGVPGANSSAT